MLNIFLLLLLLIHSMTSNLSLSLTLKQLLKFHQHSLQSSIFYHLSSHLIAFSLSLLIIVELIEMKYQICWNQRRSLSIETMMRKEHIKEKSRMSSWLREKWSALSLSEWAHVLQILLWLLNYESIYLIRNLMIYDYISMNKWSLLRELKIRVQNICVLIDCFDNKPFSCFWDMTHVRITRLCSWINAHDSVTWSC